MVFPRTLSFAVISPLPLAERVLECQSIVQRPMVICEDKVFVGFKETEWEVLKK